ncbi:MAG TPA: hypothetical protein VLA95_01115 [Gemmatimonadales bacterium]|nr:hypothetical protein [Gemmatimonadales bacterium]
MNRRDLLAALGGASLAAATARVGAATTARPTSPAVTTDDLMRMALDLVGYREVPADSAIHHPASGIRRVLFAMDVDTGTLLFAKQSGYDCVIAHHPMDQLPNAGAVYARHVQTMMSHGVPEDAARAAVTARLEELEFAGHTYNFDRVTSVARALGIGFVGIHNPLDELGRRRMQAHVDEFLATQPAATVGAVVEGLRALPEFRENPVEVSVRAGNPDAPAGRVAVIHGAYTNGGYAIPAALFQHGIPTVLMIHIAQPELARLRSENRGNLIITGHVGGDSMGFTPYLRALRERGLEVRTLGGVSGPEASR